MNAEDKLVQLNIVVWSMLALLLLLTLTLGGCGSTTGWNVSFGVTPITAVDNQQKLIHRGGAILPASEKERRY